MPPLLAFHQYPLIRGFDQTRGRKLWHIIRQGKAPSVPAQQLLTVNRYCAWLAEKGCSFEVRYHLEALYVKSDVSHMQKTRHEKIY